MKKKRGLVHLRFRKGDPEHNLHAAVQHFVQAHGGSIIVSGPIQIIREPLDGVGKFKVALCCLGREPVQKTKAVAP